MKKSSLSLIALVLAAACTGGQVATDANNGISITAFSATPSEERSGGFVLFDLEIENVGGTTARNVRADLFGVERQWRNSDGSSVGNTLPKFGTTSLKPPDPSRQLPGEFKQAQWQLMTPDVPQGVSPGLPVEVRVSFDYNTSGYLTIPAISDQELEIRRIQNQPIASPVIINSAGPIKITVPERFSRYVVIDTEDTAAYESVPLRIEFTNVGEGFPITGGDTGKITGTIRLSGPGAEFEDCLGVTGGTSVNLDNADIPTQLRETQSVPVACTIRVDKAQWGRRPEDSFTLVFNIFYRYYVRESVQVTVFGR